ncbi:MAG: efflux RND transporter permease subunit [bacterium]|nr:efflux RND transporter permease subunit [Candidatus Neomarinimicrobiota bacterium]HIL86336.1 efflux RND transporter permease subunit [Candidatus Neomarinimicrobiota bacterium]
MKGIVTWFVKNSVPANLFMFFLIVGGFLVSYPTMKSEFFPIPDIKSITIKVAYPGASSEEVESSICSIIEDRLEGVSGIKKLKSYSLEGFGLVTVQVYSHDDVDITLNDIKTILDGISTFPQNSETPIIKKMDLTEKVLDVVVYGDVDELVLLNIAKDVDNEIKELGEVSFTEMFGNRNKEITIEVSEKDLEKYNLNFDQIAMAINAGSIDLPGGLLSSKSGDLLIRTVGQSYNANEYENIVIKGQPDGSQLLLKDIATITDGFIDVERYYRWDGVQAMFISVNLVGDQDVLIAAEQLRAYVKQKQVEMPANVSIDYWYDQARYLQGRIDLLYRNFAIGMILVLFLLTMFLRPSVAFWVSMGIPISFGGALIILPQIGVTVNVLSAFMFIVVLGIVVDDAIIVGENVFRRRIKLKEDNMTSTIKGTMEVLTPVFFGVLTTIVVFTPMLNLAGSTGGIWRTFPLTAIPILIFSLIESTTILPSHLNHAGEWFQTSFVGFGKKLKAMRNYCSTKLYNFVDNIWMPLVKKSIISRYVAVSVFIGMLIITISLLAGGLVKWQFFPSLEGEEVSIVFELPAGSPIEKTQAITQIIESEVLKLQGELNTAQPEKIISHVLTTVGQHYFTNRQEEMGPTGPSVKAIATPHLGEVVVVLTSADSRWGLTGAYDIIDILRARIGTIPGVERLNYNAAIYGAGKAIHFEFSDESFDKLNQVVSDTKVLLSSFSGVYDIIDTDTKGKNELQIELLPSAEVYGLTTMDIARQVRQAFFGEEVQRIQREDDDIRIMLKLPKKERDNMVTLENMRIRTAQGIKVPLYAVANVKEVAGKATIVRINGKRVVEVSSDVDVSKNTSGMILQTIVWPAGPYEGQPMRKLKEIMDKTPGVAFALAGEPAEQADQLEDIMLKFALAIFIIYVLLAIPLKSYFKPLIVLSAIPFGVVGAVLGHLLFNQPMSVLSLLGVIALSGVVVNDSLLLVVFINRAKDKGVETREAVLDAVRTRFRPVVLTSMTTFLGILPLLFNQSTQVLFLKPMAISLGVGILFATTIILLLVPVTYVIIDDFLVLLNKIFKKVR